MIPHDTRRPSGQPGQRGFSLLEMMVALAIFALLSSAGVVVLAQTADSREVVAARMQQLGQLQRTRALLGSDLGQAAARPTRDANARDSSAAFAPRGSGGDPQRLFAIVRHGWENPAALPRASLQHVEYRLVDGRLERRTRPALDGTEPGPPQILLEGIDAVQLDYLYEGQWLDGWPGHAEQLPQAVALRMHVRGVGTLRQLFLMSGVGT